MRALLDVNVLVALLDGGHLHHDTATAWLARHERAGWSSCPLTQNGCIRVLSLTNYSLIAQEMLACGLPCVEADTPSTRAAFGADGPVALAPLTVTSVADEVMRLLDDPALREERRSLGLHLTEKRTWEAAVEDFEGGLREALRLAGE